MKDISNPFIVGKVVTGENFADRKEILEEILLDCVSGQNIIIHGPRRVGKSSLMKELVRRAKEEKNLSVIYIDLLLFDRIELICGHIFQELAGSIDKAIEIIKSVIKGVSIKIESTNLELSMTKTEDILLKVFSYLGNYSIKNKVIVVFDEFQELETIAESSIGKLRSIIQNHNNIAYVFSGSDSRLIDFFTNSKHPFYKFGKIMNLKKPNKEEMIAFLKNKFQLAGLNIHNQELETILSKTLNLPYFVQLLAHELWVKAKLEEKTEITIEMIEETFTMILERSSLEFEKLWAGLTKNQRSSVKILRTTDQPFEIKVLQQYKIAQGSVQTAIEGLIKNQIIWKVKGKYEFLDPIFENWVKKRY